MSENYIVINGKRTELTEEQLEAFGIYKNISSKYQCDNDLCYTIDSCNALLKSNIYSFDHQDRKLNYNLYSDKKICATNWRQTVA